MSIELKIPDAGESIQEVQIARWLKQEGDQVEEDEDVVELETDKASMELPAPVAGRLSEMLKKEGDIVSVGETIAYIEEDGHADGEQDGKAKEKTKKKRKQPDSGDESSATNEEEPEKETDSQQEETTADAREESDDEKQQTSVEGEQPPDSIPVTPAARRLLREYGLNAEDVEPSGERIRPEDVRRYTLEHGLDEEQEDDASNEADESDDDGEANRKESADEADSQLEETVPMSLIRRRIAQRLVEAQQSAALLTTFNEIDMSRVIELRQEFGERFKEKYGIKLGFMSFFVKAAVDALKQFPEINAEIRGDDIVYRNYYHVGIAIGSDKGLVVPVLRRAERMSFADIEQAIDDFATRAEKNKLKPDELQGGTFTISNGGIYGSLLSTPIVNPPQSGVLGMHAIEDRPVARGVEVVIRPMMYVALTYDHRLVDGRAAVSFLRRIKEAIEQPPRILIEV